MNKQELRETRRLFRSKEEMVEAVFKNCTREFFSVDKAMDLLGIDGYGDRAMARRLFRIIKDNHEKTDKARKELVRRATGAILALVAEEDK